MGQNWPLACDDKEVAKKNPQVSDTITQVYSVHVDCDKEPQKRMGFGGWGIRLWNRLQDVLDLSELPVRQSSGDTEWAVEYMDQEELEELSGLEREFQINF